MLRPIECIPPRPAYRFSLFGTNYRCINNLLVGMLILTSPISPILRDKRSRNSGSLLLDRKTLLIESFGDEKKSQKKSKAEACLVRQKKVRAIAMSRKGNQG